MTISILF